MHLNLIRSILARLRKTKDSQKPTRVKPADIVFRSRKSKVEPNSYAHLRESAKGSKRFNINLITKVTGILKSFWKDRTSRKRLLVIGCIFLFSFIIFIFSQLSYFRIAKIIQTGDQIDAAIVNSLLQQNIFFIRNSTIADQIRMQDSLVQEVFVRKLLPDTLEIEVKKTNIAYLIVGLSGVWEVDTTYSIIQSYGEGLALSDIEERLKNGTMTIDDSFINETYLSRITDPEERRNVNWAEVPVEQKRAILTELQEQVKTRIADHQANLLQSISDLKISTLPLIYFEIEVPSVNQTEFLAEHLQFSSEILKELQNRKLKIQKTTWITPFTLKISLEDGTVLLFGIMNNRNVMEQITDLDTAIFNSKFVSGKTHDFRTSTYSVL